MLYCYNKILLLWQQSTANYNRLVILTKIIAVLEPAIFMGCNDYILATKTTLFFSVLVKNNCGI